MHVEITRGARAETLIDVRGKDPGRTGKEDLCGEQHSAPQGGTGNGHHQEGGLPAGASLQGFEGVVVNELERGIL